MFWGFESVSYELRSASIYGVDSTDCADDDLTIFPAQNSGICWIMTVMGPSRMSDGASSDCPSTSCLDIPNQVPTSEDDVIGLIQMEMERTKSIAI